MLNFNRKLNHYMMKQKLLILLFAAFVLSFTGCSKPEPEQPDNPEQPGQPENPDQPDKELKTIAIQPESLTLKVGETQQLKLVVTPEDAEYESPVWTSSDESKVTVNGEGLVTAVAAGSVEVTAKVGELTATCEVKVEAVEPPQTDFVSSFFEAGFWGDYFQCGNHNYIVQLGTAEHQGSYVMGPGYFIVLSLQVEAVEDPMQAGMVTGTFTFDPKNTLEPNTIVAEEIYVCRYEKKDGGSGYMDEIKWKVEDATLEISGAGESYQVQLDLQLEGNERMTWTYEGAADYRNRFAEMYPDEITENKEFECGFGELSNEGGGLYKLDLMSGGDPYADMSWANRDRMNIYIQTTDENQLPAGTYTVQADDSGAESYVIAGEYVIEGSSGYTSGSHYFYMDGATYEAVYGFFVSGTVTISYEGEIADIQVDMKNPHGLTIRSSYHGVLK